IQTSLQEVQKSPQGAAVASYLLHVPSRNCKYFGALTYSVVIQNNALEDDQVRSLVDLLYTHIIDLISNEEFIPSHMFIVQKLFSGLLFLYTKYPQAHGNPVAAFANSLVKRVEPLEVQLRTLTAPQLDLFLVFFATLIEDIVRANSSTSAVHRSVFEDLFPILISTFEYLSYLKSQNRLLHALDMQSLKSLSAWMSYISNINAEIRYEPPHITVLTLYVFLYFKTLFQSDSEEYLMGIQLSLRILGDIFETNPRLLTPDEKLAILHLLFDPEAWGMRFIREILLSEKRRDHEEKANAYVDLALAVLQYNMIKISKSLLEIATQNIIRTALLLTSSDDALFVDDPASERMLEFWEELTNVHVNSVELFDTLFELKNNPVFRALFEEQPLLMLKQVCRIYWKKIHIPSFAEYTSVKAEFNSYRRAVADFFLVAYSFLNVSLYSDLCEALILQSSLSGSYQSLADVEAALFLLYNINDDAVYFDSQANVLLPFATQIMQSNLIQRFRDLRIDDPANRLPISTFVQYLSSNVFFFETDEGSVHLGQVFDIVFQIIISNDHSLSLLASKTATRLCEKCSRHLVQFLPNLEVIIFEMLKNTNTEGLIRLRMFNAYTVVARTINNEELFCQILHAMVTQIHNTANIILQEVEQSGPCSDPQEEYLVSLLSCLVGVAKGCTLSDEFRDSMSEEQANFYREYWHRDPANIKRLVLSIFRLFLVDKKVISQIPIVVEKCCLVVKSGFGELGGPFDFGQDVVLDLVETIMEQLRNPNAVPYVFSLIESFINVNFRSIGVEQVKRLTNGLFEKHLDFLKSDPDLLKGAIDVFTALIDCKPSLIIGSEFFKNIILLCAVEGLHANELFIIKSVSKFWTQLLNLKKGTQEDQQVVLGLMYDTNWGLTLSRNLVLSFLAAPRSNLEPLYTIFRSLIAKYPLNFKSWLIEVVQQEPVLKLAESKERENFVNQLVLTRGRRPANDVLKAFWLKCNRLVEYNSESF
ncbi:hypothetical protein METBISCDRAFT_12921, partial [Metschnikowia bicuspidata]